MLIEITIDEATMKRLILTHLEEKLGDLAVREADVNIEVKSKQNYRAEWETAAFRCTYKQIT